MSTTKIENKPYKTTITEPMSVEEFINVLPNKLDADIPGAKTFNDNLALLEKTFQKAMDAFEKTRDARIYVEAEATFRLKAAELDQLKARLMHEPKGDYVKVVYSCLTLANAKTPESHAHNKVAMKLAGEFSKALDMAMPVRVRAVQTWAKDFASDQKKLAYNMATNRCNSIAERFLPRARQMEAARNRIDKKPMKKTDWKVTR